MTEACAATHNPDNVSRILVTRSMLPSLAARVYCRRNQSSTGAGSILQLHGRCLWTFILCIAQPRLRPASMALRYSRCILNPMDRRTWMQLITILAAARDAQAQQRGPSNPPEGGGAGRGGGRGGLQNQPMRI